MSEPYQLLLAPAARRALTAALPEKVAAAAYAFMTGPLLEHPRRVGKPLGPPLAPAWSARRGDYRILFLVDDELRAVTVTTIRHRADAYRSS